MKKSIVLLSILLTVCMLALSGCGLLEELKKGMQDAVALAEDFCVALADGNWTAAQECLHPDSVSPTANNLESFVAQLEKNHNVDFSDGVAFKMRTSFTSAYYDSSYGGMVHEFTYNVSIGGVATSIFFVVVKNDAGFGIYSFGLEK